ncbi:hypothetical protein [Parapedobacter koreensis]|uniref:Uncharacterized protein n=1 Tax=Parapedobacter koreensis TaxID=332977 RepID=A0A1H7Q0B1_9SPHI|nr:hypothetical protein [Parapedobacter koreensis]SEL41601.1 hypothetical protein SAMN05421740_105114 [Parapedobacter koreensis]
MGKFEFSQAGLQELLMQLYALSDSELEVVADSAATDFTGWVLNYFELSPSQVAFLQSLNPQFIVASGVDTAVVLRHRLPINLIKPESAAVRPQTDKLIRRESNLEETSTGSGTVTASGVLTFEIID